MMTRFAGRMAAKIAVVAATLLPLQQAQACTSFLLKSADGGFTYGRTLEFGLPLQSQLIVVPRQFAFAGTGPDGQVGTGLPWTVKYGTVGANAFGLPVLADGMNEAGLVGGMLYLPGLALYQEVPAAEARTSIAAHELLTYLLTSFATVAEVKEGLPKIKVNRAVLAQLKMATPMHLTLHDAGGASLVIEYTGGVLHMHDNPTTILTNAPTFDWHVTSLSNYLGLSPYNPDPVKIGALTLSPPSTGAGAAGMPGDMSSPSRFIRAFLYWRAAPEQKTSTEAVETAFHILNNFDIPPGTIRTSASAAAGGGISAVETTEWTSVADLKTKRYYLRTYGNSQTQVLDVTKADLNAKEVKSFSIDRPPAFIDVLK